MRKVLLLFLVILLAFMTGCTKDAGTGVSVPSTIQKVLDKKKLVIGTSAGYAPFEMKDKKGDFIGYDMDLGRAIGKALNVEVEFRDFEFSGLIPALQTGEIDLVISTMTIRGDRALAVSFTDPYYTSGQVLLLPKTDTTTKGWQDLDKKGKKITVSQGSTSALLAKELFKNAEVLDFEGFTNAALAVKQGQADAVVGDDPAVRMYESRNSDSIRGIYELLSSENLGIAVQLNDHATIQWLNSFLASYRNGLEDQKSINKWFNSTDWLDEVQDK
ncbi:transporter substrate-binding domain-containing protein [Cytobacillus depressus]|uniref:Transporter substrate-binding domain-containing protein n=1 Tax=Cytobacillus depressus TaxID=1602942 RepID=A0A6L3V4L2_9BACI|nr:transporter substrate-binding domain-containing protein [Cytobacillus depressus]KAB2333372.1 transporter substrate-binding domain-containing protein [Cytobacillus depressus]